MKFLLKEFGEELVMSMEQVNVKTPEHVSLQYKLAGLGSRSSAQIIDFLIVTVIYVGLFLILYLAEDVFFNSFFAFSSYVTAIVIMLIFFIFWGYFFLFELFMGGKTPGKKLLGIRVIQENGQSATALALLIRNLIRIIDFLPVYYFIGILMIFLHSKHKRLGDIVGGTLVVHERGKKKKKKRTPVEQEIEKRGVSKENIEVDDWTLQQMTPRDWELIKTYADRITKVKGHEREELTKDVAAILLPKVGLVLEGKSSDKLEDELLAFYLQMRDEWDIQL